MERPDSITVLRATALLGVSVLAYATACAIDIYSLVNYEDETEQDISRYTEDLLGEYKPDISIKTHCRKSPPLASPFAPLLGRKKPENFNLYGTETINLTLDVCNDFSEFSSSQLVVIPANIKNQPTDILTIDRSIDYGELIFLGTEQEDVVYTPEGLRRLKSLRIIAHESIHSAFDIRDEACADVVAEFFVRSVVADGSEALNNVLDNYFTEIDEANTDEYTDANCNKTVDQLTS